MKENLLFADGGSGNVMKTDRLLAQKNAGVTGGRIRERTSSLPGPVYLILDFIYELYGDISQGGNFLDGEVRPR